VIPTEYETEMRKALRNDLDWHQATATPEAAAKAKAWLIESKASVLNQLSMRRSDYKVAMTGHDKWSPEGRRIVAEYHAWRAKAMGFQALVDKRLREMKTWASRPASDSFKVRAEAHADYMQKQLYYVQRSLFQVADAIAGFNDGEVTGAELVKLLDTVTVPHDGADTRTLQQVLDAMAAKKEEAAA
jgi:hypothetical protein